ncbi:MAG: phenylacetate--CoA ligase family protein [Alphaproteobacteria bacterium]|nr:phenylacetate--CoA ligase family protein [Alphaproteobacteria bacterium]
MSAIMGRYGDDARMERRIHDPSAEGLTRDALVALQAQRLMHLLRKTWHENDFYREAWQKAKVTPDRIASIEDFRQRVPTVEKKDFIADQAKAPPFGLRHRHALGLGCPLVVANTSGTTGQGVEVHVQTAEEFRQTGHIYGFQIRWSGLARGDGVFLTLPVTMMAGGRCEFQGAVSSGLTVFPVGNYDAQKKLELIQRFRPRALFGTTSYFGHLAAVCPTDPSSLGIKVLLTGAEGSGFPWLERLEEAFGAKVYDRYGSTQSGNDHMFSCEHGIGTAARPGMLHNIDSMVLTEVIDPATGRHVQDGEAGEIVITSLYHTDTPLVRCRTRDRGVFRSHASCACGRPFSGVEVASISRLDDMKKVKGVNIWPQAVDDVVFADAIVDEYQVVLTSDDSHADVGTLRVMPKRPLSVEEIGGLRGHLAEAVQRKVGIQFLVDVLKPGALARSEYKARRWLDQRVHVR